MRALRNAIAKCVYVKPATAELRAGATDAHAEHALAKRKMAGLLYGRPVTF